MFGGMVYVVLVFGFIVVGVMYCFGFIWLFYFNIFVLLCVIGLVMVMLVFLMLVFVIIVVVS